VAAATDGLVSCRLLYMKMLFHGELGGDCKPPQQACRAVCPTPPHSSAADTQALNFDEAGPSAANAPTPQRTAPRLLSQRLWASMDSPDEETPCGTVRCGILMPTIPILHSISSDSIAELGQLFGTPAFLSTGGRALHKLAVWISCRRPCSTAWHAASAARAAGSPPPSREPQSLCLLLEHSPDLLHEVKPMFTCQDPSAARCRIPETPPRQVCVVV
jgi:hypothetical protein